MPDIQAFNRTFLGGLQTTRDPDAAATFAGFSQFHNNRVGSDKAERRPGIVRLGRLDHPRGCISFDGVDDVAYGPLPMGLDGNWCLEVIAEPTGSSGSIFLVGANSVLDVRIQGGNWHLAGIYSTLATFSISGPAATVSVPYHVAVVKQGTEISLIVDGVSAGTVSMVADFLVPTKHATYYDVALGIGYAGAAAAWRVSEDPPDSWLNRERHLLNPRDPSVLLALGGLAAGETILLDRSRYENHFDVVGTPSVQFPSIGADFCPVQGLTVFMDENDRAHLLAVAGGAEYEGELA
jgi:hypothetical protein